MSPEQIKRIEEIAGRPFRAYHYPALRKAATIGEIEEIVGERFRAYHLPAIRGVLAGAERKEA